MEKTKKAGPRGFDDCGWDCKKNPRDCETCPKSIRGPRGESGTAGTISVKIVSLGDQMKQFFRVMRGHHDGIRMLNKNQAGALFFALLEYSETKATQEFEDQATAVAFEFIRPALDADFERRNEITAKKVLAANKRWENHRNNRGTEK